MCDRVYDYANKVKRKKEILKEELKEKEVVECTFAPKIINKDPDEKRTLESFMADQNKFLTRKQQNIERIKSDQNKKLEKQVMNPTINKVLNILTLQLTVLLAFRESDGKQRREASL
jgi:hypothetical protein